MKSFQELRKELDEVNFKADAKKLEISRTKIKNTEVFYHSEKKGSSKVRVWVKPKSAKEPEELGVFKDMKSAKDSASQFVKLMGEDIQEGLNVRKRLIAQTRTDDILKEINWLGEARELDPNTIKSIAQKTDRNDHNGAVAVLAKAVGARKEVKIMELIAKIHDVERHMSPSLIEYRIEIMNRLLRVADKMFDNYIDIQNAF